MRSLQAVVSTLSLLLVAPVSSIRTLVNITSASPSPNFVFNIKETSCSNPSFNAFEGLVEQFPEAIAKLKEAGRRLANENNCRLCDISGRHLSMHKATVTCIAVAHQAKERLNELCLAGSGEFGWATAERICMPCPKDCASCTETGIGDILRPKNTWFKCMLNGLDTQIPLPWNCEEPKQKKGDYYSWCRYRNDLFSTASDFERASDSSNWELKINAAPCHDVAAKSSNVVVAGIMQAVGKTLDQRFKQNCALCRIEAGGPIRSEGLSIFTEIRDDEATMGNQVWARAKCAQDDFGVAACRTDRGRTGWNKEDLCEPCPPECISCKNNQINLNKGFDCKLHYTTPGTNQLESLFMKSGSEVHAEHMHVILPVGYKCKEPEKRACTKLFSKSKFCMGYKTWCHANEESDEGSDEAPENPNNPPESWDDLPVWGATTTIRDDLFGFSDSDM